MHAQNVERAPKVGQQQGRLNPRVLFRGVFDSSCNLGKSLDAKRARGYL
jgi:hypothetical protein